VRSYRTLSPLPAEAGGLLSAALAVGSRLPDVIWHSVLWSPDFPPAPYPNDMQTSDYPADLEQDDTESAGQSRLVYAPATSLDVSIETIDSIKPSQ